MLMSENGNGAIYGGGNGQFFFMVLFQGIRVKEHRPVRYSKCSTET